MGVVVAVWLTDFVCTVTSVWFVGCTGAMVNGQIAYLAVLCLLLGYVAWVARTILCLFASHTPA